MKKRILCFWVGMVFMFGFIGSSNATLIDRGGGLIYDDDLDITWLADANYAQTSGYDLDGRMTWSSAVAWADSLVFGGFDDWRLPDTLLPDSSCGSDGYRENCTGSEMGHLFYDELGGIAKSSILSVNRGSDGFDFFSNIQPYTYWSGTEDVLFPHNAWNFMFHNGGQDDDHKYCHLYAWAVRSGDIPAPVPEPGTSMLLGFGLAGLAVYRKKTGRKKIGVRLEMTALLGRSLLNH